MAINPATQYPGKIDTSDPDGYPYGKAQNVAVSGDGTGTPWEKALINDLFGLGQALLGEAGITPTGTPDKVGASQYLDAILSLKRKNYITNPSMAVSQENGDGPNVAPSTNLYLADEWFTQNTAGGTMTGARTVLGAYRAVRVTATATPTALSGANNAGRINQIIEASNVHGLNGKTVTLSFTANVNWAGKLPVAFRSGDVTRTYVTDVDVVPGVNRCTVTLPFESDTVPDLGNGQGVWVIFGCNNEGTLRTASPDTWQVDTVFCTTDSTQWAKTAGNYVETTAVKLEEGTVPSAFEPNSYATDLAECQRYFYTEDRVFHSVYSNQTVNLIIDHPFKTSMRAAPVVSLSSIDDVLGGGAAVVATEVTPEKFASQTNSSAGITRASFTATANARL